MGSSNELKSVCWCGETGGLASRHAAYVVCPGCGTARLRDPNAWSSAVINGEGGIYSKEYWRTHQVDDFGYPPIEERAVSDLPERCMSWLSILLGHALPPAHLVELGCAHGGFVKLCEMAGFDAVGVEMAAEIVSLAQTTFGVDVRKGPIGGVDLVSDEKPTVYCMFDVLEHLPDPVQTLSEMVGAAAGPVVAVIQTPEFSDAVSEVVFKVPEHLYLFTQDSVKEILQRAGLPVVTFEKSCFPYDMTVVASNMPLQANGEDAIVAALHATGDGRVLNAMRTLSGELSRAQTKIRKLERRDGYGIRWCLRQLLREVRRRFARQ